MADHPQGEQQRGGGVDAAPGDGTARDAGAGRGQGAPAPEPGGAPAADVPGAGSALGVRVGVRYFAGAAAAAGVEGEVVDLPARATLGDLRARMLDLHPALERVLAVATTLVDEVAVADPGAELPDGVGIDVLPPFAGG